MRNLLTPRLLAVASMVENGAKIADIGTDHAYIPIYLIWHDVAVSAVASDLNKGPAMRAERNIHKHGLHVKIRVCVANGLSGIEKGEVDTVIMAGMGGHLMCELLDNASDILHDVKTLVLQAMGDIDVVRHWIYEHAWDITDESIAQEQEKLYIIIKAKKACNTHTQEKEIFELYFHLGKKLIEKSDKLLPLYLEKEILRLKKAINGMELSENPNDKFTMFKYLLENYTKILEGLNNGKNS